MRLRRGQAVCLAILLLTALLSSCRKPYHQETERYIFVTINVEAPYWDEAKAGLADAARVMGVKVDFVGPTTYSPKEELTAFKQAVAQRPTGILISPTTPQLFTDAINSAVADGIPVICVDSDAPDSRRILFIGTDNYYAGVQSGRRMAQVLQGEGRVVLIWIEGMYALDERLRGVKDVFKDYPKIQIVKTIDDKGDIRIANDQVAKLLEAKEKVDGILSLESAGGSGAAEVLYRLDMLGKIPIVAMDKTPETLNWISRGGISTTVAQKSYTMAFYGLKFVDDLHHNAVLEFKDWRTAPASPLPSRVDTGTSVIDSSNLAAFQAAAAERRKPL